ncbi:alpha/beta hydrolase [Phenylobacterium sp. J426]|uniref:alpha/beta fold hydrolase n=1 Tax=Phenylobacterium sp. J426 TaxID=2898439 RepID=UPI002150B4FF|nr:alpha/beta hydrolase [Phenylobacterium sp. J426]MCR5875503.1 alpha/beta hydrolase [Phenylobacterium sp. J426]
MRQALPTPYLARMVKFLVGVVLVVGAWIAAGLVVVATAAHAKPRGEFVDVGGRKLRVVCEGAADARSSIWLEHGAFGAATDFAALQQKLAAKGLRSCAYDRAGLGYSDAGPAPRDGDAALADLEALIKAKGDEGPYVLVGHSMAGLHVRRFATAHPDRTLGVVLVDATTPEAIDDPRTRKFLGVFKAVARTGAVAGSIGLTKPLYYWAERIGLPQDRVTEKRRIWVSGRHARGAAAEGLQWERAARQAIAAGPLPREMPVAVILAGDRAPDSPRMGPAKASAHGYFENVAAATHTSILGRTHGDAVVRGVEHVLAVAGGRP